MEQTEVNYTTLVKTDKLFDNKVPYSYDNLVKNLELVNSDLGNMNPYAYLQAIFEFTKAMAQLGSALSTAFADVTEKVEVWRSLYKVNYPELSSMQSVMEKELELKVAELNGENNKSLGHKKGTQYATYISGTRTLVRNSWFLHFLLVMLKKLNTTEDSFSKIVKQAYDEALAPHHSWLIRKGAGLALNFAPSKRDTVYKAFFGKYKIVYFLGTEQPSSDVKEKTEKLIFEIEKLQSYIKKWLETRKLLDLP